MNESKHTPGPWEQGNGHGCGHGYAICAGSQILARVNGFGYPLGIGWDAESNANARLIAAAPDLLEALYSALNLEHAALLGAQSGALAGLDVPAHFRKIRAAIARADSEGLIVE